MVKTDSPFKIAPNGSPRDNDDDDISRADQSGEVKKAQNGADIPTN